jgi:hypothetical protein
MIGEPFVHGEYPTDAPDPLVLAEKGIDDAGNYRKMEFQ